MRNSPLLLMARPRRCAASLGLAESHLKNLAVYDRRRSGHRPGEKEARHRQVRDLPRIKVAEPV